MSEASWYERHREVMPRDAVRAKMDRSTCLARHSPKWEGVEALTGFWAHGVPLGNGDFGALVYGPPDNLTFILGKNDLWMRSTTASHFPGEGYDELLRIYRDKDREAFQRLLPTEENWRDDFMPSSLVNGGFFRLHVAEAAGIRRVTQELSLEDATHRLRFEAPGLDRMWSVSPDFDVTSFVSAPHETLAVRVRRERLPLRSFTWRLDRETHPLLPPVRLGSEGNVVWLEQDLLQGDRYAIALLQDGAPVEVTTARRSLLGECRADDRTETAFFLAAATQRDSADPLALARRRVEQAARAGFDKVHEEHKNYWAGYWGRSWVACADQDVERTWYISNYLSATILRPGKVSPGLQGMWCKENNPPWQADFHGNINIQAVYMGVMGSNRMELFEPCARLYHGMLPQCRRDTREFFGVRGARLPHGGGIDGFEQCEYDWPVLAVSIGPSGWIARLFWWAYQHLGDAAFLAEVAYPILRDVAEFYCGRLERAGRDADGLWRIEPSASSEYKARSLDGWGANSGYDNGSIRMGLSAAVEAAALLGVDAELRDRWQRALQMLPPLPAGEDGVWTRWPGEEQVEAGAHCYPIFPCEVASAFHGPPELRAQARASWARYRERSHSAWCGGAPVAAAARMADADWAFDSTKHALDPARKDSSFGKPRSGLVADINNGAMQADHGPGLSFALNSMLGLGVEGTLIFFPAMPPDVDVAFHSLRFPGPVLAGGEQRDGRVRYVTLQPLTNNPLRVLNPFDPRLWGAGETMPVRVRRMDTDETVLAACCAFRDPLEWRPRAGAVYAVESPDEPLYALPIRNRRSDGRWASNDQ